jgi:hypothetical protein
MGYTAWSAGGFSATSYNLTMTPQGSAGNFVDQQTVSQCVVGVRNGNSTFTKTSNSTSIGTPTGGSSSSKGTVAVSVSTKLTGGGTLGAVMVMIALTVEFT